MISAMEHFILSAQARIVPIVEYVEYRSFGFPGQV